MSAEVSAALERQIRRVSRIDEAVLREIAEADRPAIVMLEGSLIPTPAEAAALVATGRLGRFVCPWLPDEAQRLLDRGAWEILRPFYWWPGPADGEGGPRKSATGPIVVVAETGTGAGHGLHDAEPLRAALALLGKTEVWAWPEANARPCEAHPAAWVVQAADARALAWALDAATSSGARVLDLCGRISPSRAYLDRIALPGGWRESLCALARWKAAGMARLAEAEHQTATLAEELAADGASGGHATTAARLSWLVRNGMSPLGENGSPAEVFSGLLDGYVHGWRRPLAEALLDRLEEPGPHGPGASGLCLLLALTLGRTARAEQLWAQAAGLPWRIDVLTRGLRQWLPLRESGLVGPADPALLLAARWAEQLWAEAPADPAAALQASLARLATASAASALEPLQAVNESAAMVPWAVVAIHAWAAVEEGLAGEAWTRMSRGEWPTEPHKRFPVVVATGLVGGEARAGVELERLGREVPTFFAAGRPAHTRCGFGALALAAVGEEERARAGWRQALEQDPAALLRDGAWHRACARGGFAP